VKQSLLLLLCLLTAAWSRAQYPMLLDKVVAQVGDQIVLKSDIEFQYLQYAQENVPGPTLRCELLDQMVAQKMLVLQAAEDSVVVSEEEVDMELNQRFNYFIGLLGSEEKLEEFYGKPILQLKEEFRQDIADQLLARRMQSVVTGDVRISPAEVRAFFKGIPEDSLPFFNAEVTLSHLVLSAVPNADQRSYARERAEELLDRIRAGEKLSFLAGIYSDDPGSREQEGDLGCLGRGMLVPAFEAAAFRLKNGEVSDIVETEFGFHIIEMIERRGEQACLRHILVQPKVTSSTLAATASRLDSIRNAILEGSISFQAAVAKYSQDVTTNKSNGELVNPSDGTPYFGVEALDRETYFAIENLKPGELSAVVQHLTPDGKQSYRIVQLRSETEPHRANLEQDYSKIQAVALQGKRARLMEEWMLRRLSRTYLRVDPSFTDCPQVERWLSAASGGLSR
jgi:peptidyl-prolyl cis-trans isomerase SurA